MTKLLVLVCGLLLAASMQAASSTVIGPDIGAGSGTVSSSTAGRPAYFAATGTTIVGFPGCVFQASASPNVQCTAQDAAHVILELQLATDSTTDALQIKRLSGDNLLRIVAFGSGTTLFQGDTNVDITTDSPTGTLKLGNLNTRFRIIIVDESVGIGPSNANPDGTFLCKDGTTTTGSTLCSTQAGQGQGTNDLYRWRNNAGGILASVGFAGRINASGVSASESYKSGFAIVLGSDTAHDIDVAKGIAQSFDLSQNIVFVAQAGKQLDVKWATGAAAGMLGMPDLTPAIVLTFSLTANPDTITAGSETPFAICNDGGTETGTIIIQGGSTNNGTYEVASCTDTVLTLGNGVLSGDETGDSGEYEARYVQPDTWYHVYLIELADAEDICADTSEIAANCLSESSYDMWRLLQSVLTDATANLVTF